MENNNSGRAVVGEVVVNAGIDEVWKAWTTPEGTTSFLAPACNLRLEIGGPYEMFFDQEAAPGLRGGEGLLVLAFQPPVMLSVTWNAPPELPDVRGQHTHVVIRLEALSPDQTRVWLAHDGWGTGGQWEDAFAYFQRAWLKVVLPRLAYRFEHGPIDWDHPPKF